jgi:hypothetical protein
VDESTRVNCGQCGSGLSSYVDRHLDRKLALASKSVGKRLTGSGFVKGES